MVEPTQAAGILTAEATGPLFTAAARVCGVCTTRFSQYKCPKCALAYCSLGCYKRHGEHCTESFYAEQAQRELRSMSASQEQSQGMMRTLQRFESEQLPPWTSPDDNESDGGSEEEDEDQDGAAAAGRDGPDGAEQLAWMLQQSILAEEQLPDELRTEFRRLVADGSLGASLQARSPNLAYVALLIYLGSS